MTRKEKIISFAWQHLLLFVALYIMTLGIAACVKSMLGASVISVLPYVFHNAGTGGLTSSLTIGQYTFIMNALLVVGQVGVLRRHFDPVQLFQLLVGFVFGMLIDLNLYLLSWLQNFVVQNNIWIVDKAIVQALFHFTFFCISINTKFK